MAPTPGNRALLAQLKAVDRDLGLEAMEEWDPALRGAPDISFVAGDVDGLAGLGASGGLAHAPGEYVDLSSLARQAKRSALLLTRLSQQPRLQITRRRGEADFEGGGNVTRGQGAAVQI